MLCIIIVNLLWIEPLIRLIILNCFIFNLFGFQRQLMENYIKQKRAAPGMVQASDLQIRPMSGTTQLPTSAKSNSALRTSSRELHAYDGPMQFMMSPNNPDQILPTSTLTSPSSEGMHSMRSMLNFCNSLFSVC